MASGTPQRTQKLTGTSFFSITGQPRESLLTAQTFQLLRVNFFFSWLSVTSGALRTPKSLKRLPDVQVGLHEGLQLFGVLAVLHTVLDVQAQAEDGKTHVGVSQFYRAAFCGGGDGGGGGVHTSPRSIF
jgi:hypothetical protein